MRSAPIEIGLHAAVVAVDGTKPLVLTVSGSNMRSGLPALPFGPFDPQEHRTMEVGLRLWVEAQTRLPLGYVEQLYTFGDHGRMHESGGKRHHLISVGYLALVRKQPEIAQQNPALHWQSWYDHFPWEDWQDGEPAVLGRVILPSLTEWMNETPSGGEARELRAARVRLAFGCDVDDDGKATIGVWDEERVLERYELMYEAGLVQESLTDEIVEKLRVPQPPGIAMLNDHRRILATAMARLRAKLKYRPVVFELMPQHFTLTELQKTVETLSGRRVHKQNFRRLVNNADLVEPTGTTASETGGRPAAYFRFKRSITRERPAPGLRVSARS